MTSDLKNEQRRVRFGALSALAITIAMFAFVGGNQGGAVVASDALPMAIYAALAPSLCLVAAIVNVANRRYFSAVDINAAVGTERSPEVAIASAILANTLEQAVLAVILYAALAALVPGPGVLLASLATLFVIGRLAFALGYSRGAGGRAFGFGLTFYPNAIGLSYVAVLAAT